MIIGVMLVLDLAVNETSRHCSSVCECACSASARGTAIGGTVNGGAVNGKIRWPIGGKLVVTALVVANGSLHVGNRVRHVGRLLLLLLLRHNSHAAVDTVKTIVAIAIFLGSVAVDIQSADVIFANSTGALNAVLATLVFGAVSALNAVAVFNSAAAWCG